MTLVHERKCVFIQPQTRLDAQGGTHLKQQLPAIEPESGNVWVMDMTRVEFVDSAGLVALIGALNAAIRTHNRLILCNVRPAIKLIFEITQLDQAFEMVDSLPKITETALPTSAPLPVDAERVAA